MALLWQLQNDQWQPVPLTGSVLGLSAHGEPRPAPFDDAVPIRLHAAGKEWILLAAPMAAIRVNGRPVVAGIRVLRDRDEITLGGSRCFFSTERLAQVELFPGADGGAICPRCRQPIAQGSEAVRCPGCGTWHHQSAETGCWVYAPKCALCDTETARDAGYRWQPEF